MGGSLQELLSGLTRPLAHVVHIGAGTGTDLAAYLEAGAKTVTLIEGDAGAAERLEGLAAAHEGVTVIGAVVSGDTRKRAFRQMNFPDLSSLRVPTGLKELFPGLRILSKEVVSPVNPARLIAPLELSDTGANLLVIEAPGEALGILGALETDELLQRFDAIHLQEAREPLYDQAPPAEDIRAFLVSAGFIAMFEINPEDPERPRLSAQLDRAALQHKRAHEALVETLEQAQGHNEALTGQLEATQKAADEKADQQRAELAAMQKTAGAEITALQARLAEAERQALEHASQADGLRTDLTSARAQAAQEIATLQNELAGAQQESGQRAQQVKELHAAREESGQEMDALRAELADAQARLARAQQETAESTEQVKGLRVAREESGQEMNALRAELSDAQARLARAQQETAESTEQVKGLRAELKAAHKAGAQDKEACASAEHRLTQAREEMLKAEGQISLIRDLLLQGSGL